MSIFVLSFLRKKDTARGNEARIRLDAACNVDSGVVFHPTGKNFAKLKS
jgi:hypothetical protein